MQGDRGRTEALVLGVAAAAVTDLGRLARDLIDYSSEARGFLTLAPETTTGSSIMPQKRNPDGLEIIRATAVRLRHLAAQVEAVYGGVGAGYHRDLQLTKQPFIEGMIAATDCLATMRPILSALEVDVARCRTAVLPSTAATDAIYLQVARGVPFRQAYREVARDPEGAYPDDPATSWRERRHAGAPGDTDLGYLTRRAEAGRDWLVGRKQQVAEAWGWFEAA